MAGVRILSVVISVHLGFEDLAVQVGPHQMLCRSRSLQLWNFEKSAQLSSLQNLYVHHGNKKALLIPDVSPICDVKENKNVCDKVDVTNCEK